MKFNGKNGYHLAPIQRLKASLHQATESTRRRRRRQKSNRQNWHQRKREKKPLSSSTTLADEYEISLCLLRLCYADASDTHIHSSRDTGKEICLFGIFVYNDWPNICGKRCIFVYCLAVTRIRLIIPSEEKGLCKSRYYANYPRYEFEII